MSNPRKHISIKTKLAAALCQMLRPDEAGNLVPIIPHDEARKMTAEQVISRFEWNHHPIPHAFGGPSEHWNLDPEPKEHHRKITAEVDIPRIAKAKRISKSQEQFRQRILAKGSGELPEPSKPKRKIPSRPFQKRKAQMRAEQC